MEDIMHIQSAFLRSVIAQAISKTARKQGYKSTEVKLNDIFARYSETEKKVHLHLDMVLYEMVSLRIIFWRLNNYEESIEN